MSNIKFVSNLFLEKEELNRFKEFLFDDGIKQNLLNNIKTYGIVRGVQLPTLTILEKDCFDVTNVGAGTFQVIINSGRAVDKNGNVLTLSQQYTLAIPNTPDWYWIKIAYRSRNEEIGTVDVDASGNLTGTGTEFLKTLRGQPNFPAKVVFTNAALNTGEYDIASVVSDTVANLAVASGTVQAEVGLTMAVVGTFTPGYVVPGGDKKIFEYDDIDISLVLEDVLFPNVAPAKTQDEEFYLARVQTNGLNCIIHDKRTEFLLTKVGYEIQFIDRTANINQHIGVEKVLFDGDATPKYKNEATVCWGFTSDNWTLDATNRLVTLNGGSGGIFKDTSYFINNSFNGYRIYTKNGKYNKIASSTLSGGQINLVVDYLDQDDYVGGTTLTIVPDVEEIQIKSSYDAVSGINTRLEEVFTFPIYECRAKLFLRINDPVLPYLYCLTYRYKNYKQYTDFSQFPNDVVGHYTEKAYQSDGSLLPAVIANTILQNQTQGYLYDYVGSMTDGFCQITPSANNYQAVINSIYLGDLAGVEYSTIDQGVNPVLDLIVGTNKQYQVITINPLLLAGDVILNLSSTAVDGNVFYIKFESGFTWHVTNRVQIRQDYVNPGSPGTLLCELDEFDCFNAGGSLLFRCEFDGTNWIYFKHISLIDFWWSIIDGRLDALEADVVAIESAWTAVSGIGQVTLAVGVVNSCEVKYKINGKTMMLAFNVDFTPGAAQSLITIDIPNGENTNLGFTCGTTVRGTDAGLGFTCIANLQTGSTDKITIVREDFPANFTNGAVHIITGLLTFEIA